ncbi:MAG: hypothetical protein H0T42_22180 [Deltaproteobacteria bacterium]|nr:hypothetical protein [Deltaproteobacteria bacterium]
MSALKVIGAAIMLAAGAALFVSAYRVVYTNTRPDNNYLQLAGFGALLVGFLLWKLSPRK